MATKKSRSIQVQMPAITGMSTEDLCMEFERAILHTPKKCSTLLKRIALLGHDLTEVVPGELLLHEAGARAMAEVMESNIPTPLNIKKLINMFMEWMVPRIQGGDGDPETPELVARALRAIEKRKRGVGIDLATEMMGWAIQIWEDSERDEEHLGRGEIEALVGVGIRINNPIPPTSRRKTSYDNLLHFLVARDVKKKDSGKNDVVELLVDLGSRWSPAWDDPKLGKKGQTILEHVPEIRRKVLGHVSAQSGSGKTRPTSTRKRKI